ncbi:SCO family protein [Oleiharenicola lentus]|uniref:SCO family protein n=1 Tax=Oleiharenicola lentus TaxID=2508720 RepID=UPI003F67F5D4
MHPGYSPASRLALSLLMAAGVLTGCGKREAGATQPAANAATQSPTAPSVPGEKRYALTGEVLKADLARKVLIVQHDEIKGYMPAMTMEFRVETSGDLQNAKPGQRIRAEMVERGDDYFLEKIWPDDAVTTQAIAAATNALAQDTSTRGKGVYREIGEEMPLFTLLDQEGRAVNANRFRGKQIVLNFIFTRCPIATMCPAATLRMMDLQKAAKDAGVKNFELVSISLDPEYDTPGVLKEYAEVRGIDTANWSFLTGPDAAVRHLLAQLGIIREFEGATIKHTLATVLINEQGKISYRIDGSSWPVDEFVRRLKRS